MPADQTTGKPLALTVPAEPGAVADPDVESSRNPPWQRDELILALGLYLRHRPSIPGADHPDVVSLSDLLNALPIHADRPDRATFRNPNGVSMKLSNFLRFDPTYRGRGLQRGGRLEKDIWDAYAAQPDLVARLSGAIRLGHLEPAATTGGEDQEEEFPEGRVLYRLHRTRERDCELVRRAKERALRLHGRLACEVPGCGFDFQSRYGELGGGYIECHHTLPLSELAGERGTRLGDVALVCANCHRMLHRRRPWLGVDGLAALLAGTPSPG